MDESNIDDMGSLTRVSKELMPELSFRERLDDWRRWHAIKYLAESNHALKVALDRVFILYELSKDE
jgi:hypothetical protein